MSRALLPVLLLLAACRNVEGEPCTPGEKVCAQADATLLTCNERGNGWFATTCDEGLVCAVDQCLLPSVQILTTELPPATVGEAYSVAVSCGDGTPPYTVTLAEGALPPGLMLTGQGAIAGVPELAGSWVFSVLALDAEGTTDQRELTVSVSDPPVPGVQITSSPLLLPGEEGFSYTAQLRAIGGTPPYGWMVSEGALPGDLQLFADGRIEGTLNEVGDFSWTVRVVDNSEPLSSDSLEMSLHVGVAPLTIVGDVSYDLRVTTVVVMDMLVPFVPYNGQLHATGGLRPRTWAEVPIPPNLEQALNLVSTNPNPTWGLPPDLTVDPDGKVHGWVTDVSDAPSIHIPFTSVTLTGYFFMAEVVDAQSPAEQKTGLFLLPTIALGGP